MRICDKPINLNLNQLPLEICEMILNQLEYESALALKRVSKNQYTNFVRANAWLQDSIASNICLPITSLYVIECETIIMHAVYFRDEKLIAKIFHLGAALTPKLTQFKSSIYNLRSNTLEAQINMWNLLDCNNINYIEFTNEFARNIEAGASTRCRNIDDGITLKKSRELDQYVIATRCIESIQFNKDFCP